MSDLDESITEDIQNNETLNKITTTQNTLENPQENNKVLEVSMEKQENLNIENTGSETTPSSITVNETTTTTITNNNNENNNCNNNNESQQQQPPPQPSTPLASDSPSSSSSSSSTSSSGCSSPSKPKIFSVKDIGVSYEKNPRFRRTMEDEHVVMDRFAEEDTSGYFAIYDGHGGRGAVEFTAKTLHNNLLDEIKKDSNGDMLEALKQSYLLTDKQMEKDNVIFSGTTAISALIKYNQNNERYLYIANAGDARAVISEEKKAIRLSYDHKGSDPEETKRITQSGGFVVNNRVNGILAVTRSLGDHSMKEYVVGDPYKYSMKLDSRHTHLILACDGLWDVTPDQEAIDLILNDTDAQKMSDKLLLDALKRGSTDNISIIVIIL